jgi:hypothetical protein
LFSGSEGTVEVIEIVEVKVEGLQAVEVGPVLD